MLSADSAERSSTTQTLSPRASRRSAKWEPIKPAPPVIRTFIPAPPLPLAASKRAWSKVVAKVPRPGNRKSGHIVGVALNARIGGPMRPNRLSADRTVAPGGGGFRHSTTRQRDQPVAFVRRLLATTRQFRRQPQSKARVLQFIR